MASQKTRSGATYGPFKSVRPFRTNLKYDSLLRNAIERDRKIANSLGMGDHVFLSPPLSPLSLSPLTLSPTSSPTHKANCGIPLLALDAIPLLSLDVAAVEHLVAEAPSRQRSESPLTALSDSSDDEGHAPAVRALSHAQKRRKNKAAAKAARDANKMEAQPQGGEGVKWQRALNSLRIGPSTMRDSMVRDFTSQAGRPACISTRRLTLGPMRGCEALLENGHTRTLLDRRRLSSHPKHYDWGSIPLRRIRHLALPRAR
ncbi:hypothetical protein BV25DRAFT_1840895 [Artomyces pyxidatus]|uniref:Uncharacterized protein n=1 Tax=Artomyces pyxidatus TaxID=48021 RepID=A0ACB8SRG6_9AGAM|nr:hypothetical protein BV25DRAFT_1840895 [Artomyces pyxidatus]